MEREPARARRVEEVGAERQLRTERPVACVQTRKRDALRQHGEQNQQHVSRHADARTNPGADARRSTRGCTRAPA